MARRYAHIAITRTYTGTRPSRKSMPRNAVRSDVNLLTGFAVGFVDLSTGSWQQTCEFILQVPECCVASLGAGDNDDRPVRLQQPQRLSQSPLDSVPVVRLADAAPHEKRGPRFFIHRPGPREHILSEHRFRSVSYATDVLTRSVQLAHGESRLQTASRLRPFLRRRFSTFRPPGVAIRARNPWVRLRGVLCG